MLVTGKAECAVFEKGVMIGKDDRAGTKKYILAEVNPCRTGCLGYPGDPGYQALIKRFFAFCMFNSGLLNSKTDIKDFE